MPEQFILPDLGEGIHEAQIVQLLVKEGDVVREDQPLMEVETDKAAVEIPSPQAGTITSIHVEAAGTRHVAWTVSSESELSQDWTFLASTATARSKGLRSLARP